MRHSKSICVRIIAAVLLLAVLILLAAAVHERNAAWSKGEGTTQQKEVRVLTASDSEQVADFLQQAIERRKMMEGLYSYSCVLLEDDTGKLLGSRDRSRRIYPASMTKMMTALVVLLSGAEVPYGQAAGAELTISGFTTVYGNWVSIFTAIAMCCFAFSTIIGWGLYGARCAEFLLGSKILLPFNIAYSLISIVGATVDLGLIWSISETFNGFMTVPNLIAVFLLTPVLLKLIKEYFGSKSPKLN